MRRCEVRRASICEEHVLCRASCEEHVLYHPDHLAPPQGAEVITEGHAEVITEGHAEVITEGHAEVLTEGHAEGDAEGLTGWVHGTGYRLTGWGSERRVRHSLRHSYHPCSYHRSLRRLLPMVQLRT